MTQYMRPNSDINTGWSTSGANRWSVIDEAVLDNYDYISTASNAYQECKLSAPADTPASGGGTLKFVAARDSTGTITPSIRQGSTVIKAGSAVSPMTVPSFKQYSLTLSAAEMANITDWTDVRVRFTAVTSANVYVTQAFFEVPDGGSTMGLEMGCAF